MLWNFGSLFILTICGFLVNLLIAWNYSASVLGIFNQVYAIYIVASQFSIVGVHLSVLKYSSEYIGDTKISTLILQAGIILAVIFSSISCGLLFLIRNWLSALFQSQEIARGIMMILPGLFFFALNKVFLCYLNGLARIKEFAIFQSVRYILLILSLGIIMFFHLPEFLLPAIFTFSEIILSLSMLVRLHEVFHFSDWHQLHPWIMKHFSFGMRGFLSNVLLDLNTRVDILILGYISSDRIVGIYSLAIILIEGLYQIPIALRANFSPLIVTLIKEQKIAELKTIIEKGKKATFFLMSAIGLVSIAIFPLGVQLFFNQSDFMHSWPPFVILMVALILSSSYLPFNNIILQAGFPGTHTVMILIQVCMNIVLNFLLASRFGAVGSALATGIAMLAIVPLIKIYTRKILTMRI